MVGKPTPAQLTRLRQVAEGDIYREGHTWFSAFRFRGSHRTIPYDMMGRMKKAGWIDVEPMQDKFYYDVVLTDAGRKVLGLPAKEPENEYPLGYMQGRGAA